MAAIKVYGAPWCPDCKRTKKFLAEQRVEYDWFDINADREALRYVEGLQNGGHTIPTVVFEDGSILLEPSDDEVAAKLGLRLRARRPFYDLIVIGGGPAGLTASIYAAREGLDTLVIEKSALGGNAGVTERIDNYPGFPEGIGGGELADRFVAHARRYNVELLSAVGVKTINREGHCIEVVTDVDVSYAAHAVIIATGSSYRRLNVPGEDPLIGVNVHFCATCDGPFYKGAEELLVVGGGNSGLEEGLFLSQFANKVRVLEFAPELKASQLLQDKVRSDPKFEVQTNTEVVELRVEGGKLAGLVARNRETGETETLHPDAVFVFIGLDPNTGFLRDVVELDRFGFIQTDDVFQTSIAGVFAAGDVRRGSTKQLGAAVGEGVAALLHARQYLQKISHVRNLDEVGAAV